MTAKSKTIINVADYATAYLNVDVSVSAKSYLEPLATALNLNELQIHDVEAASAITFRLNSVSSLPRAQCRHCPSEALGARRAQAEAGKRPQPIHRGEFVPCDPRRTQMTTGASVRLTCVAQAHPYSPRCRAKREYERRSVSRLAQWASDGQCRRCGEAAAARPGGGIQRSRSDRGACPRRRE